MNRDILEGRWIELKTEAEFNECFDRALVRKGEFNGPGTYKILAYDQRCPRNCCYDDVIEVVSAKQVVDELEEGCLREYRLALAYSKIDKAGLLVTMCELDTILGSLEFAQDHSGLNEVRNQIQAVINNIEAQL